MRGRLAPGPTQSQCPGCPGAVLSWAAGVCCRRPSATNPSRERKQRHIDDINVKGGLWGRQIDLYLEDSATTDSRGGSQSQEARPAGSSRCDLRWHLQLHSSTRQAIKGPAVVNGKKLYIYPEQYEGQECDPLIFCTGPVPAQQVEPLITALASRSEVDTWSARTSRKTSWASCPPHTWRVCTVASITIAPPRVLHGQPHHKLGDSAWRHGSTPASPSAAVVLLGDQFPVPTENRVARNDACHLGQRSAAEFPAPHRESPALRVSQLKRPTANLLAEDPILLSQTVDQILLTAVQPASEGEDEELQGLGHPPRLRRSAPGSIAAGGPTTRRLGPSSAPYRDTAPSRNPRRRQHPRIPRGQGPERVGSVRGPVVDDDEPLQDWNHTVAARNVLEDPLAEVVSLPQEGTAQSPVVGRHEGAGQGDLVGEGIQIGQARSEPCALPAAPRSIRRGPSRAFALRSRGS